MVCPYDGVTEDKVRKYVRGLTAPLAAKGSIEGCAGVAVTRWVDAAHIVVLLASLPITALLFWRDSPAGWTALEWLSLASTLLTLLHFRDLFIVAARLAWYGLGAIKFVLLIALAGAATTRALDSYRASPSLPLSVFRALLGVTMALALVRLALLAKSVSQPDNASARMLALAASLNRALSKGHITSVVARV